MARPEAQHPQVLVGGFTTISCSRAELAELLLTDALAARAQGDAWLPQLVFSSNGQGIALAGTSPEFMTVMSAADIVHADGMPVVFASKMTPAPLPERIPTTDFFHDAARIAEPNGLRFFMLGATEAQNAAAVDAIHEAYPHLDIVGRHHGYFGEDQDEAICAMIRESRADVVWIALGKPRQEEWCLRNRERLRGVAWLKTCGGLYAFLAGDVPRAPEWMQKAGLEWLFRLLDDPQRLAWRYLTTNPYAFYRLARYTQKGRTTAHGR
nr:WecB/TagA/CpsF family glycosyltransferase [Actinomycetota bacterium]